MSIRGALHVHSTLSRDGTMTIAQLARYFKEKGYHVLAMGAHAEDLDDAKLGILREQSPANSDDKFLVIPGVEFAVTPTIHIVALGVANLARSNNPSDVAAQTREQGGMSVLAHPNRFGWDCPPEVLRALDAVEIWNVGNDGKFLPAANALAGFQRMRQVNPKLLAIAGHDFLRTASFYKLAIEIEAPALSPGVILQILKLGAYRVRSPFFNCNACGQVSPAGGALVRHVSGRLETIRKARSIFGRFRRRDDRGGWHSQELPGGKLTANSE